MGKNFKWWASYLLLFVAMFFCVRFLVAKKDQLLLLCHIPWQNVLIVIVLTVIFVIVNAYSSAELTRSFGVRLTTKEWIGLSCVTMMLNQFLPAKSGFLPRAVYMKEKYNFLYSTFFAAYLGFYVFLFMTASAMGIFFLYITYFSKGILHFKLLMFFCSVLFLSFVFLVICDIADRFKLNIKFLKDVLAGLTFFNRQWKLLLKLLAMNVLCTFILAARLYFIFGSFCKTPDFVGTLIIANVVFLSVVTSFTPGNLGIKEIVLTLCFTMIGASVVEGAMVSLIDRVVTTLVFIFMGGVSWLLLFSGARKKDIGLAVDP
ncbi:MAG: flippase-like domain-containing protein [Candidatus Omnitrophica bacterium]|nr:flippase-like domain-containing protein [Candidatus Omnitrophota bacterium]